MSDVDLLAELDAVDCWCRRTHEECEERGGCRWTRALAEARRTERVKVEQEILTKAREVRDAEGATPADDRAITAAYGATLQAAHIAGGDSDDR